MDDPINDEDLIDEIVHENINQSKNKKTKIIIISSYVLLGLTIIGLLSFFLIKIFKEEKVDEKLIIVNKSSWIYFGEIIKDIPYDKNGTIENTFRKDGINYNKEIIDINNNENYTKNGKNFFDLYIPNNYLLDEEKNKNVNIILFLHGGAWIKGDKSEMEYLARIYAEMGYITASMSYTLLIPYYSNYNIFRIIDEITYCIDGIKNKLIEYGFKKEKLSLGIVGYSAGAHLALLYTYLIPKNLFPIDIKFTINVSGPISLNPKDFYEIADKAKPFENINITSEEVEKAINEKKFIRIINLNDTNLLLLMNQFYGGKYSQEQCRKMINNETNEINKDDEEFKKLYNIVKNAFPVDIVDKNKIPVLCAYGGLDNVVGVVQFPHLNEKAIEDNKPIELYYSINSTHDFFNTEKKSSFEGIKNFHPTFLKYVRKYFGE